MITLTGLGLMMSGLLIHMSGGNLFILLLLTMVASIILGMGVPPVAAYIVLAILVVPALIKLGVYPLAAHLFVFYFATIAGITPPMAPDAFVAAGIADAPMMRTAFTACRLALVIFIIPYMFVYNNALLLIGSVSEILLVCVTAFFGVMALAFAAQAAVVYRRRLPDISGLEDGPDRYGDNADHVCHQNPRCIAPVYHRAVYKKAGQAGAG